MSGKELIKELNLIKKRDFMSCKESWEMWRRRRRLLKKAVTFLLEAANNFESSGRYIGKALFYKDKSRIIVKIRSSFCDFSNYYAVGRKSKTIAFILDTINRGLDITINGKVVEDEMTLEKLENKNVLRFLKTRFNQAEYFECW
jgi:hypothetical protein